MKGKAATSASGMKGKAATSTSGIYARKGCYKYFWHVKGKAVPVRTDTGKEWLLLLQLEYERNDPIRPGL